jgi:hypothetical protein
MPTSNFKTYLLIFLQSFVYISQQVFMLHVQLQNFPYLQVKIMEFFLHLFLHPRLPPLP